MDPNDALKMAIEILGSEAKLGRKLGTTQPTVHGWFARGVPPERCRDIEAATDMRVTRAELRPDIFG